MVSVMVTGPGTVWGRYAVSVVSGSVVPPKVVLRMPDAAWSVGVVHSSRTGT